MKELLQTLVQAIGPTGHENTVRELIKTLIEDHVDEIIVDALGNLIARKGEKQAGGLRIMLSAHIDEIGVIATHIDEKGFVRFTSLGGVRPYTAYAGHVRFINGTQGVIGMEPVDSATTVQPLNRMFIDVGAESKDTCPVSVGDFGVFERPFIDLGKRVVSKAMDDRAGAAVLVDTIRQLKQSPHELWFVFSTQEEVGLRGARTSAYRIEPDVGIALDVTLTGDLPKADTMDVALGKGPAIKVKDSGMISSPAIVGWMCDTASEFDIPYQLEVLVGGTTDAAAIQINKAGALAGCISIPCRYVHSPSEMVDMDDIENAVKLVVKLLENPVEFTN